MSTDKMVSSGAPPSGGRVAAYTLTLLFIANVLNYADRALLGIVVEPVRKELLLSDTQISLVSGLAFSMFFLVAGVAVARWVDRGNRRLILILGVIVWSVATAATGYAQDFYSLAAARMLVGVGEAAVFPVALSLLAEFYPGPKLSRSVSIFQGSSGVGILIGSILAGVLAATLGWRMMFHLFGLAGVAVAILIALTMTPTPRAKANPLKSGEGEGFLGSMKAIMAVKGIIWLALGYGASNMVLACLPVWSPAFLLRSHGVPLAEVGALVGPPAVAGALLGNIVAGILATRLIERTGRKSAGLIVPIIALPLAVPAYALFLFAPSVPVVMLAIAVMNFLLATSLGPCVALAVSLVSPARRGLTSTFMLIVQTLLAFTLGPLIVGVASDALTPTYGEGALRYALALMLVAPLSASVLLWIARRKIPED